MVVTRRVFAGGPIMIGGQKIQAGVTHARKTASHRRTRHHHRAATTSWGVKQR